MLKGFLTWKDSDLLVMIEGAIELKSISVSQNNAGLLWSSLLTKASSEIIRATLISNAEILKLVSIFWR